MRDAVKTTGTASPADAPWSVLTPFPLRVYVYCVVLLGAFPLLSSLVGTFRTPPPGAWLLLAVATVISGRLSVRVPSVRATVSVSDGLVFAGALLFGPGPATVMVSIDGLAAAFWNRDRNIHRLLLNISEPALSVWSSAQVFYLLADRPPIVEGAVPLAPLFLPILAMTTGYYVLNCGLIAGAVALETGTSPTAVIRAHVPHVVLNYVTGTCLLLLIVPNAPNTGLAALVVAVPLLVVSHVASRVAMGRVEDTNRHLEGMNRLYLSMIETLAVAIDAKDQVTHGHIRRVQAQAVALAKALGVTNPDDIRAIEAAALLHDVGKLAVPEHILNKPGALTPAEFEVMKTHVTVGTDILSRIDFPYPVIPIVGSHHEAWDGSGYPDGLSGETIPIGARVLAVVDCFDALTSDRPYRRGLSAHDALQIIASRRGRLYDPAVVDMFTKIWRELPNESGTHARDRTPGTFRLSPSSAASAVSRGRTQDLEREARELGRQIMQPISVIGPKLAAYAAKVVGEAVCVLYAHDASADCLVPVYVSSDAHKSLEALSPPLGTGVSGWVAANQEPITNGDAALDVGDLAAIDVPRLRTCLCVPLGSQPSVLTLYSADPRGFSNEHARLIALAAAQIIVPPVHAQGPFIQDEELSTEIRVQRNTRLGVVHTA